MYADSLDQRNALVAVLDRAVIIVPPGTANALTQYLSVHERLRDYRTAKQAAYEFVTAFQSAVQQMRRDLGTDPLTEANLRAMGVFAAERQTAMIESYQKADRRLAESRKSKPVDQKGD